MSCLLENKIQNLKWKKKFLEFTTIQSARSYAFKEAQSPMLNYSRPNLHQIIFWHMLTEEQKELWNYAAETMQSIACLQIPVIVASGPYTCNKNINLIQPEVFHISILGTRKKG